MTEPATLPDPLAHRRRPAHRASGGKPNAARPVRNAFGSPLPSMSHPLRTFPLPHPFTVARRAVIALAFAAAPLAAHAQASAPTTAAAPAAPAAPQPVDWEIRVLHDGRTVDTFHHTTTVGQSRTDTHDYALTLPANCTGKDAEIVAKVKPQRSRSVTVAPLYADGGTVTLQLDAQETLDDGDGCTLAPRQISASHPGLAVHGDGWTDWAPADKNAHLLYQVRAHVVAK